MAEVAGNRPITLQSPTHEQWGAMAALVLSGARNGTRVCAADAERMELLVTAEFVCTPSELTTGVRFSVTSKDAGAPAGQVIGEIGQAVGNPQS